MPPTQLVRLAFRNVFRQRLRSALTLGAIAFGVLGLVVSGGFVHDIFIQLGEAVVHSQSGHIQIAREGFFTYGSQSSEKFLIGNPGAIASRVQALPEVAQVMGRFHFSGLLGNGRTTLPIVGEGIEPEKEAKLGTYMTIKTGRNLQPGQPLGMLVGEGVARALDLKPGDPVSLVTPSAEGAMNSLDCDVVGTFQSFSRDYDDRAVKILLPAAQDLLGTPGANLLVVELRSTSDTVRATTAIRQLLAGSGLEVRNWMELNDFYGKTVELYDRQFGILRLIVLVMVLLCVANTVNMSLFERIPEFGTMCALGDRRSKVLALVMTEGLILGLVGSAIGLALGILLALALSAVGIPMPPPPNSNLDYMAQVRIVPVVIAGAAAVGVAATLLATVVAARRVTGFSIVDALRRSV